MGTVLRPEGRSGTESDRRLSRGEVLSSPVGTRQKTGERFHSPSFDPDGRSFGPILETFYGGDLPSSREVKVNRGGGCSGKEGLLGWGDGEGVVGNLGVERGHRHPGVGSHSTSVRPTLPVRSPVGRGSSLLGRSGVGTENRYGKH